MLASTCAQAGKQGDAADDLERQLRVLRAKRFLKTLAIVQDLADTLLAVNDVLSESADSPPASHILDFPSLVSHHRRVCSRLLPLIAFRSAAGGQGRLSNKAVLASAGLLSAALSAYRNWT